MNHGLQYAMAFLFCISFMGCKERGSKKEIRNSVKTSKASTIRSENFGQMPDGQQITAYTLENGNGMRVKIITYGGRIISLNTPDKNGKSANITLGFDNLTDYLNNNPFFGALVGRYANRIANGKFSLDGKEYTLATNNGPNHLHGGPKGFDKVIWEAEPIACEKGSSLRLKYHSKNGEEGYPGNVEVKVVYSLFDDNALEVAYEATTDQMTIINLTQHAYFNLSGDFSKKINDHVVHLNADAFLPVDSYLIPTGELRDVTGTPFDFKVPKTIGEDIDQENEQIVLGGGYDHCWVVYGETGKLRFAASAYHEASGRYLEVLTTEPGIQFYTGNFLDGKLHNPAGGTFTKRSGFCLETQHYPDSPNKPEFPSVTLLPGETYNTKTVFRFSTQ